MRTEDVVVSGRSQLQLEVQARIRRGEAGTTTTTATTTPTSNVVVGSSGYLPNGPAYGITYARRPHQTGLQTYVEPQSRQDDRQFIGN